MTQHILKETIKKQQKTIDNLEDEITYLKNCIFNLESIVSFQFRQDEKLIEEGLKNGTVEKIKDLI